MADVIANGVRHHVQRLGRGARTVVFIHGLVMDNLSSFYFTLASPVARAADVILYDLRGHGRTERPRSGYTIASLVADLGALLDELVPGRPVELVSHSFGGVIALAFAVAHPERVARLALIECHVGMAGWAAEMTTTLTLLSQPGAEHDARVVTAFQAWPGRDIAHKRAQLARVAEALIGGTTLIDDLRRSPAMTSAALATIPCPVLALYGERSDLRATAEHLARTLPVCSLHLLAGCTHSILWEATDAVRERIVGFVGGDA